MYLGRNNYLQIHLYPALMAPAPRAGMASKLQICMEVAEVRLRKNGKQIPALYTYF